MNWFSFGIGFVAGFFVCAVCVLIIINLATQPEPEERD